MQNPNSVCFVGKIEKINNIEGADKIVQAVISGWESVIQKDEFSEGENVIIAVTDAVIPFELAEKLNITKYLKHRKRTEQYTVRTTKLRGVYSMATIIQKANVYNDFVGEDMMDRFGIKKYEEPTVEVQLSSGKKIRYHKNPNFHVYHKFPNAKNAPNVFTEEDIVQITNKIHGCNARYGIVKKDRLSFMDKVKKFVYNHLRHSEVLLPSWQWVDYDYVYGSHEVEKGSDSQGFYSSDVWREIADSYSLKAKLWELAKSYVRMHGMEGLGEGIILYGEIYGPGIQKYYDYNEKGIRFKAFDLKINGQYQDNDNFDSVCQVYSISPVEVLYTGKFNPEKIELFQNNRFIPNTKIPEEGVVVKAITGDRAKIVKYINPAYLEFQSKKEDSTDFH